jgi:hypothetical protein
VSHRLNLPAQGSATASALLASRFCRNRWSDRFMDSPAWPVAGVARPSCRGAGPAAGDNVAAAAAGLISWPPHRAVAVLPLSWTCLTSRCRRWPAETSQFAMDMISIACATNIKTTHGSVTSNSSTYCTIYFVR